MAVAGLYLAVQCAECGKKYKVPAEKLTRKRLVYPCTGCSAQITIIRPEVLDPQTVAPSEETARQPDRANSAASTSSGAGGVSLKTFLLFFCAFFMVILGLIWGIDNRVKYAQNRSMQAAGEIVEFMTRTMVGQLSEVIAEQTSHYLSSHPYLRSEDFNTDIYFKKTVLQNLGVTGRTWLYERGAVKEDWKIWVDYDHARVGRSMKDMEKVLGKYFPEYWAVVTQVGPEKKVTGVSKWPDSKGILRDRFVAVTPVEKTPYFIGASIFMAEVTLPFKRIQREGIEDVRRMTFLLLSVAAVCALLFLIAAAMVLLSARRQR